LNGAYEVLVQPFLKQQMTVLGRRSPMDPTLRRSIDRHIVTLTPNLMVYRTLNLYRVLAWPYAAIHNTRALARLLAIMVTDSQVRHRVLLK
jgi:hypothetical protein